MLKKRSNKKQEQVMSMSARKKEIAHNWGAWIWVKWKPGAPENVWKNWKKLKKIKHAWSTSGQWDCALWIDIDDPDDVERFVWKEIRNNKWVEKTETHWSKIWW